MLIQQENGVKKNIQAVWIENNSLPTIFFVDQRSLPFKLIILESHSSEQTGNFIQNMVIRGAPSIGAAGAFGILQSAIINQSLDQLYVDAQMLLKSRPTAIDLKNCINIMLENAIETNMNIPELIMTAEKIVKSMIDDCKNIAKTGLKLINKGCHILTHCHTGALATVDVGTALSIPKLAHEKGIDLLVYVKETRPRLQGGRLTAWELSQAKIKYKLIVDSVAGLLMQQGRIDIILVGADRIVSNGDFANKIGTYSLAILAKYHKIPFYVVAPWSTFDLNIETGKDIPIEERSSDEVTNVLGSDQKYHQITNQMSSVYNPAFDITPESLITGIIAPGIIFKPRNLKEHVINHFKAI